MLDVREQREYEAGHLLGAVNLPYEELDEVESCISKDRPVVIYCAYGGQSLLAARELAGRGYDTVNALGGLYYYRGKYYVTCKEKDIRGHNGIIRNFQFRKFLPMKSNRHFRKAADLSGGD